MQGLDLISLGIGSLAAAIAAVLAYFLNQHFLFKTRILFPPSYYQVRFYTNFRVNGLNDIISAGAVATIIKITGWNPARGVEIFVDGDFNEFYISPDVPFLIDGERNSIKIGVLNRGMYEIKAINKNCGSDAFLSIKGIESVDAIARETNIRKPGFVKNVNWLIFLLWIVTLMVISFTMARGALE